MKKYFNKITALLITAMLFSGCSDEADTDTGVPIDSSELLASIDSDITINSAEAAQIGELISIYPYADVNPDYKTVSIDGSAASSAYRGLGLTADKVSSRLLLDYKEDEPSAYQEILEHLFGRDNGAGFSHITIVDSFHYGECDIRKNAAFTLATDAKAVNPEITLGLLIEGNIETSGGTRYEHYKKILETAYDEFELFFDYINFSETEQDVFVDIVRGLKTENESRYDYNKIKFTVPEDFTAEMLENAETRNAADIVRIKSSSASEEITELNEKYGKGIWYADGSAPAEIAQLSTNVKGYGLSGENNALDICNRIINGFYGGNASVYDYSQAVASNYINAGVFPKSLITAQTPWNGKYRLNAGFWTSLHFSGFAESGWKFVNSACFGDGAENNGSISETKNNYVTLADTETGDFSVTICNDSSMKRGYTFIVTNLKKADKLLHVWETSGYGEDELDYDEYNYNYLQLVDEFYAVEQIPEDEDVDTEIELDENGFIINAEDDGETLYPYAFSVTVKPYSVMTVTTLDRYGEIPDARDYEYAYTDAYDDNFAEVLPLPWSEDYEYDDEFLSERGNTPKYTVDLFGAFEVVSVPDAYGDENKALMYASSNNANLTLEQLISYPSISPTTVFGDDRWADYEAQADFLFDENGIFRDSVNFAQFGVRHSGAENKTDIERGYSVRVYENGDWELRKNMEAVKNGKLSSFDYSVWHTIKITAADNVIAAYLDGEFLVEFIDIGSVINSGRLSITSAAFSNCFDNIIINETDANPYIVRVDDRDIQIAYEGKNGIELNDNAEYVYTLTSLEAGASFDFWFYGSEISFIGKANNAVLKIWLDGEELENNLNADCSDIYAVMARLSGFEEGSHNITAELLSGEFTLNFIEYA